MYSIRGKLPLVDISRHSTSLRNNPRDEINTPRAEAPIKIPSLTKAAANNVIKTLTESATALTK